jgi:hypothetical protein
MTTGNEERKTRELTFDRPTVNLGLLHQQLKAVLGEHFPGISHNGSVLRVHLFEDAPAEVDDLVAPVVAAHDPAAQSESDKQVEDDTALLTALKGKPVAQWKTEEKDKILELLLRRVT